MRTQVKRRYSDPKAPEFQKYSDYFDRFLMQSEILNPREGRPTSNSIFYTRKNILQLIYELKGEDKDGRVYRTEKDDGTVSVLKDIKNKLELNAARLKSRFDEAEATGHKIQGEPIWMMVDRVRLEARMDVVLREIEYLQSLIAVQDQKMEEEHNKKMLIYSCIGQGRLFGGELVEIDFQKVERIKKNLIITEPLSPYRGMKISDYREKVVDPFCKDYYANRSEFQKKQQKELKETGHSLTVVPPCLGFIKISRTSLPAWPKGVKNYLDEKVK